MKYRNASEIFPDELLMKIRKYSSGELIYVPETILRRDRGSKSGAHNFYIQRNSEIRTRFFQEGKTSENLLRNTSCL